MFDDAQRIDDNRGASLHSDHGSVGSGSPGANSAEQSERSRQSGALTVPDEPALADVEGTSDSFIVELGRDALYLFHDVDGVPCAQRRAGDAATFRLPSSEAKYVLYAAHRRATGKYPKAGTAREAMHVLAAEALHEGPEHPVALRVGGSTNEVWLDLGPSRTARITAGAWEVVERPAVMIRRPSSAGELPEPAADRGLERLREVFAFLNPTQLRLVVGWLVMTLCPFGPYPALAIVGEPGSGKSTLTPILKSIVDPSSTLTRAAPKSDHDLALFAESNWIVSLDNLSWLRTDLSDALCRLLTGSGFGTRELYTTGDERVFDQCRPVLLNGIGNVVTRQDLLDRTLIITLKRLKEFVNERAMWAKFEAARPAILASLLDVVAKVLERLPSTPDDRPLRMSDFVRWVEAAEPALGWQPGSFLRAAEENHADAQRESLEGSLVGQSDTALLSEVRFLGRHTDRGIHALPQSPRRRATQIRQMASQCPAVQQAAIADYARTRASRYRCRTRRRWYRQ